MDEVTKSSRITIQSDEQEGDVFNSLRNEFFEWLSAGNVKKYKPSFCLACIDKVSEYALNNKICYKEMWQISKHNIFRMTYDKLLSYKWFRITEGELYKAFIVVGHLYLKFLKEFPENKKQFKTNPVINKEVHNNCYEISQKLSEIDSKDVIKWLVNQPNSKGTLYLENVVRQYMSVLRSAPLKLEMTNSMDDRNVFACTTVAELDMMWEKFRLAPNYREINQQKHSQLSAGLSAYRRYLEYVTMSNGKTSGVITQEPTTQQVIIPNQIIEILTSDYNKGFKFDSTAVRILAVKVGFEINDFMQSELKRIMFQRSDDIYFIKETIAPIDTYNTIINHTNYFLNKYEGFELNELYIGAQNDLNYHCIRNLSDFEDLLQFIYKGEIRCVTKNGTRIVRTKSTSLNAIFGSIAKKIISLAYNDFGGVLSEDDLKNEFAGFSSALLAEIIGQYAEELVKSEINDIVCYFTSEALGIDADFTEILIETLNLIEELGLMPTEEILHTAISLKMGVNFKEEYNIPDDKTFRRLIASYYKAKPLREWKGGIFTEALN